MVGAHHEGNQQQRGKRCQAERAGCRHASASG
jgi:hypothetical protein